MTNINKQKTIINKAHEDLKHQQSALNKRIISSVIEHYLGPLQSGVNYITRDHEEKRLIQELMEKTDNDDDVMTVVKDFLDNENKNSERWLKENNGLGDDFVNLRKSDHLISQAYKHIESLEELKEDFDQDINIDGFLPKNIDENDAPLQVVKKISDYRNDFNLLKSNFPQLKTLYHLQVMAMDNIENGYEFEIRPFGEQIPGRPRLPDIKLKAPNGKTMNVVIQTDDNFVNLSIQSNAMLAVHDPNGAQFLDNLAQITNAETMAGQMPIDEILQNCDVTPDPDGCFKVDHIINKLTDICDENPNSISATEKAHLFESAINLSEAVASQSGRSGKEELKNLHDIASKISIDGKPLTSMLFQNKQYVELPVPKEKGGLYESLQAHKTMDTNSKAPIPQKKILENSTYRM